MSASIIEPVIAISSILSTLPESSMHNVYQKLRTKYHISASRLISAALLSITDKSVDLNKLKTDIIGIRNALPKKASQTVKSVNTSLFENRMDDDVATYMSKFWTDKMFNNMVQVNKGVYIMFNKLNCIANINSSKRMMINNEINSEIYGYNEYQLARLYHNIHSLNLFFNMSQRRRECDFPSSLEKEDFEIDLNRNAIDACSKLKRIAIGEDSLVMVKKENLNQIVKHNKHLNELTLSLTNPFYRNGVKVDAIRSFLNSKGNSAASSEKLKLQTLKIEYKSDGSDNSKKIASVAIEPSFVTKVHHLDLSGFHDDSGSLNNVKFPKIAAEKSVQVLTLPRTCAVDLQQQNNKDIQSQLNIETLTLPLPTRRAKDGIRLIMNENDSFKYGFDQFVTEQNKSEHLYAINKFNESLNLQNSVITAVINVDMELFASTSVDTMVDIFWGNTYSRYCNKFSNLDKLILYGLTNDDVTVRSIRDGKELVQKYTDLFLNNVPTLKSKIDSKDKIKPPKLNSLTMQAKVVIQVDDSQVRTPTLPQEVHIDFEIPSLKQNSKKQLKQTTIPPVKREIRTILNTLQQNSVNDFNNHMSVIWHVNINLKCEL